VVFGRALIFLTRKSKKPNYPGSRNDHMSAPIYVIDTHPLVWYLEDSPKLSQAAKDAFLDIENGDAQGLVPTIVLA
jgi:hypothetical protein